MDKHKRNDDGELLVKHLALALAFLLLPCAALGQTTVFPGFPVPVPATQGGTGQTSFVTNCIVAATSSSALGCTGTPAITTGATFTANPGGLAAATLNDYEVGTYVPSDASGASLPITNNETAQYVKLGRFVWFTCDITYPTTASGAVAAITLPFAANGVHSALSVSFNSSATPLAGDADSINTTSFSFVGVPSITQRTNVQLSTFRFIVSGTYEAGV